MEQIKKILRKWKIKQVIYRACIQKLCRHQKRLLVFESNLGRNYTGNPRAVYEELLRRGLDLQYQIVWILLEPDEIKIPGRCMKVRRESLTALKKMWQASFWIMDTRQMGYVKKNRQTKFIMTWHGTPLKKLGLDLEVMSTPGQKEASSEVLRTYKEELLQSTKSWDYLIAPNQDSSDIFRRCFGFKGTMLNTGYPRNDALLAMDRKESIEALKKKFNLPINKRILLYAPTWRDYEGRGECDYYFAPKLSFDALYEALQEEAILIVQLHYYIKDRPDFAKYKGFIREIKTDIRELYLVSDIMITDYSSTMFDYSILNRPMVFYPYDIEQYDRMHGFYFDYMSFVPGPVAMNTDELIPYLKKEYDFKEYREALESFRSRFNAWEKGNASAQITDLILKE